MSAVATRPPEDMTGTGRPRLLDLFCGAGGCAVGYHRAGFDVVGVDIAPQPNYPFEFHRGDALRILAKWIEFGMLEERWFDAIHASPPCQAFSIAQNASRNAHAHPDLIAPTRERLVATGLPYVIENVPGAPLVAPIVLCGSSFGLGVKRHRLFECSFPVMSAPCQNHGRVVSVFGGGSKGPVDPATGKREFVPFAEAATAMGIDWMTRDEMSQAIPPAFTEHIGGFLMAEIRHSSQRSDTHQTPAHSAASRARAARR